jgi:hypothetical protein
MSLTVKHLNADTTFLLTFSPVPSDNHARPFPQSSPTFSILVDPWLSGPSTMWHPKFLYSRHVRPSCVQHLSELPAPNVVLVSQDKPDHCHEATLRQLDPSQTLTTILAVPAAAKKIRNMKHFNPSNVHALPIYSDRKPDSLVRFFIPPLNPGGTPGEATLAFIPERLDISGLHNAIGITYRPPTAASLPSVLWAPPTPPTPSNLFYSMPNLHGGTLPLTPPESPGLRRSDSSDDTSFLASSPHSPAATSLAPHTPVSSISSTFSNYPTRLAAAKTISIIYSPHGVSYSLLRPYASSHLVQCAALPLTALLHSFDRVQNPWWMGGNINSGLPGGIEIAKGLMARCWISAHDEEKDNTGLSVMRVVTRKHHIDEVRSTVGGCTAVEALGVGTEMVLTA